MRRAQGFERVEFLHLLRREERANLIVELLQDRVRLGPRLLVNRLELRLHGGDRRLHLRLLRIGQVERVGEHRGEVMRTVMMMRRTRLVVGTLGAGELTAGQRRDRTERERNQFVCFHVVVCFFCTAISLRGWRRRTVSAVTGFVIIFSDHRSLPKWM